MSRRRPAVAAELIAVAAPSASTAVLALRGLGDRSLWQDEGVSAYAVSGSTERLVGWFRQEPHFALYHALLRAWRVFGSSDFSLRLMSVFLAVLAVPAVYAVARRLFGARVAAIAAALLSANGFFLGYAQEMRSYSLLLLTSILATLCVLRALDEPEHMGRWTVWVIAAAATALSHPFGAMVIAAHAVVLLVRHRSVPLRDIALTAALPAGIIGALGFRLLAVGPRPIAWIPRPTGDYVARIAYSLAGSHDPDLLFGYACGLILLAASVARVRGQQRRLLAAGIAFGVGWLAIPVTIAIIVTFHQPVLIARYLIVAIPPLAILVAAGLGQLRALAAAVATAALLALSIPTAMAPLRDSVLQDWRGAAAILVASAEPADVIILPTGGRQALLYYLDRTNGAGPPPSLVTELEFFGGVDAVEPCRVQRMWLVRTRNEARERIEQKLAATHELVRSFQLEGVVIRRFEWRSASSARPCAG